MTLNDLNVELTIRLLGWERWRTSCGCGGSWAWFRQRNGGAWECMGCVCHNTPFVRYGEARS